MTTQDQTKEDQKEQKRQSENSGLILED